MAIVMRRCAEVGLGAGGIVRLAHVRLVHFQDFLRESLDLLEQGQQH